MIEVKDLHKSFGKLKVLDGISTTIEKGERDCHPRTFRKR